MAAAFAKKCLEQNIEIIGIGRYKPKYNGIVLNPDNWMKPEDIADMMLCFLRLSKKVQVSEVTIDRKNFNYIVKN